MIGLLRGHVLHKHPPFLLLDVGGVGYEIEVPMSTFFALPADHAEVTLHTHLAIRDDAHVLYGFVDGGERALFRALLKVSGVGGKMALAILSGMTAEQFRRAVQSGDTAALVRLPGVGKKTAERLIVEMRDRLEEADGSTASPQTDAQGAARQADPLDDAIAALLSLGYKPGDARRMLKGVAADGLSTEEIIKQALQGG